MSTYIAIIIAAVLTNNFVLSKFYGLLSVSRAFRKSWIPAWAWVPQWFSSCCVRPCAPIPFTTLS